MTTLEILQCVAETHNTLANALVSGDNAIIVGDVLRNLRMLAQNLQADLNAETGQDGEPA